MKLFCMFNNLRLKIKLMVRNCIFVYLYMYFYRKYYIYSYNTHFSTPSINYKHLVKQRQSYSGN